jgi:hypothetical protein
VLGIATPSKGKLKDYSDRRIKANKLGQPYSLNCEVWGPGFIFPFITGLEANQIYQCSINKIGDFLPFLTIEFREECSRILVNELERYGLTDINNTINIENFLSFVLQ